MSTWNDNEDGYFYTVMNPALLDQLLDRNNHFMDQYNRLMAWHKAQWQWRHDNFVKAEASSVMKYQGPATKAKFAANDDDKVTLAKTYLSIAAAQLGICERRLHALEKEVMNLALRNKLLSAQYNNGGGSY